MMDRKSWDAFSKIMWEAGWRAEHEYSPQEFLGVHILDDPLFLKSEELGVVYGSPLLISTEATGIDVEIMVSYIFLNGKVTVYRVMPVGKFPDGLLFSAGWFETSIIPDPFWTLQLLQLSESSGKTSYM